MSKKHTKKHNFKGSGRARRGKRREEGDGLDTTTSLPLLASWRLVWFGRRKLYATRAAALAGCVGFDFETFNIITNASTACRSIIVIVHLLFLFSPSAQPETPSRYLRRSIDRLFIDPLPLTITEISSPLGMAGPFLGRAKCGREHGRKPMGMGLW